MNYTDSYQTAALLEVWEQLSQALYTSEFLVRLGVQSFAAGGDGPGDRWGKAFPIGSWEECSPSTESLSAGLPGMTEGVGESGWTSGNGDRERRCTPSASIALGFLGRLLKYPSRGSPHLPLHRARPRR